MAREKVLGMRLGRGSTWQRGMKLNAEPVNESIGRLETMQDCTACKGTHNSFIIMQFFRPLY